MTMNWNIGHTILSWFRKSGGSTSSGTGESSGLSPVLLPEGFDYPIDVLFLELRRHGFSFSVDTSAIALHLFMKAIESGELSSLDLWLCPLLAHTAEQQQLFHKLYNQLVIPILEAEEKNGMEKMAGGRSPHQQSGASGTELSREKPPMPAKVSRDREKIVASLKARSENAYTIERFVQTTELVREPALLKVVRQLRCTERSGRYRFDIGRSIQTVIHDGGMARPVYMPERRHIEYLMLVDRQNSRDHQARLHDDLFEILKSNNIFVDRFYFDKSPLICFNHRYPGGITLTELQSLYEHAVLMLFADGLQFIDTRTVSRVAWSELFRNWERRYFFSSVSPALWGVREQLLQDLFSLILPLSVESLQLMTSDMAQSADPDVDWLRYCQEHADYSLVPVRIDGRTLDRRIELFFNPTLRRWIAACAVYPELNWNLTLALGKMLVERYPDETGALHTYRYINQLLRLQWFRNGRIPDHFRLELIRQYLTQGELTTVSRFLYETLGRSRSLPGEADYADRQLELALYDLLGEGDAERVKAKAEVLGDLVESGSVQPDMVTLHLVNEREYTPICFEIPDHVLKHLGVDPEALRSRRVVLPENYVLVRGGEFEMGSPESEEKRSADETQHRVRVSDFAMCRFAVTVGEFRKFIESSGYRTDAEQGDGSVIWTGSEWKSQHGVNWRHGVSGRERGAGEEGHPVLHVSWNDAEAYSRWLTEGDGRGGSYRLPTEAEWEYACRGGTKTPFNTGENLTTDQANYDGNYPYGKNPTGVWRKDTVAVDAFEPNGYGLYNMHGNVWEWCSDWYGSEYYEECRKKGVEENPQGPEGGSSRVLRGGSWNYYARNCRSAYRNNYTPATRHYTIGFRLVFVPQFKR